MKIPCNVNCADRTIFRPVLVIFSSSFLTYSSFILFSLVFFQFECQVMHAYFFFKDIQYVVNSCTMRHMQALLRTQLLKYNNALRLLSVFFFLYVVQAVNLQYMHVVPPSLSSANPSQIQTQKAPNPRNVRVKDPLPSSSPSIIQLCSY